MNNTPLVIVLLLVAAAAAGGWYKYFDERGIGSEESARAEQLATDYALAQQALQAANKELKAARADVDKLRMQGEHQQASANSQLEKLRVQAQERQSEAEQLRTQVGVLQTAALAEAQQLRTQAAELQALELELEGVQNALLNARQEFETSARVTEQEWSNQRAAWDSERTELRRSRDTLEADLAAQRRTAEARIKQLTHELAAAQGTERTTRSELERLRAVVARLGEHEQMVTELSAQLRNKDTDLTQMEARMAELEQAAAEDNARFAQLRDSLQSELTERDIQLEQLADSLTRIRVGSDILFETGSAELSAGGEKTLTLVARILNEYPNRPINVEGHTDNVPIGPVTAQIYPSNWELSSARAARAVRYLEAAGVETWRLNVVGHGAQHPVASNDDAVSRARNRRIEIAVLPADEYRVIERK